MIPAIACVVLPVLSGCSAYVEYVPTVSALEAREAYFSGRPVEVTGEVRRLVQRRSRTSAQEYEVFVLCRGTCVRVFMRAHSSIRNSETVTVRGVYYERIAVGRDVYHNEIEAAEILPRD